MSEISERYARMAQDFRNKVEAVPASRWSDPSPCEGWSARDVVRHAIDSHALFEGQVGRSLGDIPNVNDDPLAAFDAACAVVQADLDDPTRAGAEYDGFFGRTTFEASVGRFLIADLLLHGWDLARATGLDEVLDSDEVHRQLELMAQVPDEVLRTEGVFAAKLEAPAGADDQTRLLALTGRRSWDG